MYEELFDWNEIKFKLKSVVDKRDFESWIEPLEFDKVMDNNVVILKAPSSFVRYFVSNYFYDTILEMAKSYNPKIEDVEIIFADEIIKNDDRKTPKKQEKQDDNLSILDPKYKFEYFVSSSSNEFALAIAKKIALSENANINPTFIYSGIGLGKTHLMQSIAWEIKEQFPEKKIAYLSSERFANIYIKSLETKTTSAFKETFRSLDLLLIDDFQFMQGKKRTQEEFFHTFNALMDQGKQVVASADKNPMELQGIDEKLASRLQSGVVVNIFPSDFELRKKILEDKISLYKYKKKVPEDVVEFLAHTIVSNIRDLEGALKRILTMSELLDTEITMEIAQNNIRDMLHHQQKMVTVENIQRKVAEYYKIKISDMQSSKRTANLAHARQVAIYLAHKITEHSLPAIGKKFGGRDHTTVLYAIKKIENNKREDSELEKDLMILEQNIKHSY